MGEGGASVATDLCVVCVTRPRHASIIHGDTGHQVCCLECASRLKTEKKKMSCVPQKNQTCCKNFFLVNCCSLNNGTVFTRIIAPALIKFFCTSSAVLNRRQRLFKNWKLQRNLVFQFTGISSICTKSYSNRSVFPLSPFSSFNYKLCGIP